MLVNVPATVLLPCLYHSQSRGQMVRDAMFACPLITALRCNTCLFPSQFALQRSGPSRPPYYPQSWLGDSQRADTNDEQSSKTSSITIKKPAAYHQLVGNGPTKQRSLATQRIMRLHAVGGAFGICRIGVDRPEVVLPGCMNKGSVSVLWNEGIECVLGGEGGTMMGQREDACEELLV